MTEYEQLAVIEEHDHTPKPDKVDQYASLIWWAAIIMMVCQGIRWVW